MYTFVHVGACHHEHGVKYIDGIYEDFDIKDYTVITFKYSKTLGDTIKEINLIIRDYFFAGYMRGSGDYFYAKMTVVCYKKRADKLFKYIIEQVCNGCGFKAIRVDQIKQSDLITQTIIDYLNNAELVIADMSSHNPNAFYEMGFRACTGRPMINLSEKGESIPFDISAIRAFEYDLSDLNSVDEVKRRLEQTINS